MAASSGVCARCVLFMRSTAGGAPLFKTPYLGSQYLGLAAGGLFVRHGTGKHYDPKWRKLRAAKVKKVPLPNYDDMRRGAMMDPDESVREMKKQGMMPYRDNFDRPIIIASTNNVFEAYVPPEGDGKSSILGREGGKQRFTLLEKKGKSRLSLRKIRDFEGPDFKLDTFATEAQEIYIEATKLLENIRENEERLHQLVTENAFPKMTWKMELKTFRWNYIETLEPPRVVHCRTTNLLNKEDVYAQITVRFHSQQTLAIYDRFGRLMYGSEKLIKDVLEYVVFEKHLADEYGTWRLHDKIIPDWMPPSSPTIRTVRQPDDLEEVEEESEETAVATEDVEKGGPTPAVA